MNKKLLFSCSILSLILLGCAPQNPHFNETRLIETKIKPITIPDIKQDYKFSYQQNDALKKAYNTFLKTGKAPNIETEGFETFAYGAAEQPIISTKPLELTIISLEPGENVLNVSSGDPTRWSYSLSYSGDNENKIAHILIKPSQINLSTDLVIATDKRLYTLKLVTTTSDTYARNINFWYPEEMQEYWNNLNTKTQQKENTSQFINSSSDNLSVFNLNFNYRLGYNTYHAPFFLPKRVFDDGTHTYIEFANALASRDMPVLFIQDNKTRELVNYRYKKPYFIVDKIFQKAILVLGVGNEQKQVFIINKNY